MPKGIYKRTKSSPMKNKHHTKEAKEKIRDANRNKKLSDLTKQKISKKLKGKYIGKKAAAYKDGCNVRANYNRDYWEEYYTQKNGEKYVCQKA